MNNIRGQRTCNGKPIIKMLNYILEKDKIIYNVHEISYDELNNKYKLKMIDTVKLIDDKDLLDNIEYKMIKHCKYGQESYQHAISHLENFNQFPSQLGDENFVKQLKNHDILYCHHFWFNDGIQTIIYDKDNDSEKFNSKIQINLEINHLLMCEYDDKNFIIYIFDINHDIFIILVDYRYFKEENNEKYMEKIKVNKMTIDSHIYEMIVLDNSKILLFYGEYVIIYDFINKNIISEFNTNLKYETCSFPILFYDNKNLIIIDTDFKINISEQKIDVICIILYKFKLKEDIYFKFE